MSRRSRTTAIVTISQQAEGGSAGDLVLVGGALSLFFGSGGSSDFWVDALQCWSQRVRPAMRGIRQLVIYLDNGPDNSGRRTRFPNEW